MSVGEDNVEFSDVRTTGNGCAVGAKFRRIHDSPGRSAGRVHADFLDKGYTASLRYCINRSTGNIKNGKPDKYSIKCGNKSPPR